MTCHQRVPSWLWRRKNVQYAMATERRWKESLMSGLGRQ